VVKAAPVQSGLETSSRVNPTGFRNLLGRSAGPISPINPSISSLACFYSNQALIYITISVYLCVSCQVTSRSSKSLHPDSTFGFSSFGFANQRHVLVCSVSTCFELS